MVVPAEPPSESTPVSPLSVKVHCNAGGALGREGDGLAAIGGGPHGLQFRAGREEYRLARNVRGNRRFPERPGIQHFHRSLRFAQSIADIDDFRTLGIQRADEKDGHAKARGEIACYVKGMPPILKRILVNGLLAAATLAAIGIGFAELATMFMAAKTPDTESPTALHYRVPAMLALWGFLFVALGEWVLAWWRSFRPTVQPKEPQPDPADVLLEQIMSQVETAQKPTSP